jgi:hypothetical protein
VSIPLPTCPNCSIEIRVNKLRHQGIFNNFRICPDCGGKFTVDQKTKYRQAAFFVIALISLALTILLYSGNFAWLWPALLSYLVLGVLIYWGNKKVFFVPYQADRASIDDT